jgi:hypothetical protein
MILKFESPYKLAAPCWQCAVGTRPRRAGLGGQSPTRSRLSGYRPSRMVAAATAWARLLPRVACPATSA